MLIFMYILSYRLPIFRKLYHDSMIRHYTVFGRSEQSCNCSNESHALGEQITTNYC